ncbi:MAG: tetratricopeptide repeat protein [Spirulinaceae cyanobacterium]
MPKSNWLFSFFAGVTSLGSLALPASGQALLPYTLELDSEQLEQQGLNLVQDAVQLVRFQQYELALPRAKLATQVAPDNFQTWFVLGSLYLQNEEADKAIESLQIARSLSPEDESGILFTLGSAYFQKENYQAAIENIEKGLAIEPNAVEALFDLGNSYLMLKNYSKALSSYEQAYNKEQKFWPAINNIGLVKYEQGDITGAIKQWEKALEIDSEAAEPQLAIAVAWYTHQADKKASGLALGKAALNQDNRYGDLEFLKQNLWGDQLLADTARFLSDPQVEALVPLTPELNSR